MARFEDLPTVSLMGVRFQAVTESQAVARIVAEASSGRGGSVVTPNLHILRLCVVDAEVRELVSSADLVLADGMPLVWASRVAVEPLPERVAGSNMIYSLTGAAAEAGLGVYFLGGNPGAADAAAEELSARYAGLSVRGTCCPAFGFDRDEAALERIVSDVQRAAPAIVYVGLGCPKQERLMQRLAERLPGAWLLGVGYSFSFVAGETRRAPRWMQKLGMEWLHRMASEPRRLVRRYCVEGIPFFARLMAQSLRARRQRGSTARRTRRDEDDPT